MTAKPIVKCRVHPDFLPKVGHTAIIEPIDHPNHLEGHAISNSTTAVTSFVVSVDLKNQVFVTQNTVYSWSLID